MTQSQIGNLQADGRRLQEFVRESMRMERWWLRYFSLLHVTGLIGLFLWVDSLFPRNMPAGFHLFVVIAWPCSFGLTVIAGFRHSAHQKRLLYQTPSQDVDRVFL